MSPTPPRRERRLKPVLLGLAAFGVLLGVIGALIRAGPPATSAVGNVIGPHLSPPRQRTTPPAPPLRATTLPHALGRAVAAVGAYDDGRRASLDDLPPEVAALVDQARVLLAGASRRAAPGLPMRHGDGSQARIEPDPPPRGQHQPTPIEDGSLAQRERARAVAGRLVARTLATDGRLPPPVRGELAKELVEPDAWIAVPYDPRLTQGQALTLTNRSLGEYVLRLDADDYGSVRLNDGLVVPGRYYLVQGTLTITSEVPVGVIIRPLGVVHAYDERPVAMPTANG
jgi:hypothetical protein